MNLVEITRLKKLLRTVRMKSLIENLSDIWNEIMWFPLEGNLKVSGNFSRKKVDLYELEKLITG